MTDDRDITERLEDPSYDGAIYMRQDAAKEIRALREYSSKQAFDIMTLGQEVGRLREALQDIFDYECRTSSTSLIACLARDALWPRATLAGKEEK